MAAGGRRYRIELKPTAAAELARIAEKDRRRIAALAEDPRPRRCTKLEGEEDLYRVRAGDYRILYAIRDELLLVLVVRVGHRRDVYRGR